MSLYLVTGGAGFIGSNIVEALLQRDDRVRILDNFSTGKRENIHNVRDRLEIIEGDIRSYHVVREAVDGVEFVLHQAALPSVPRSIKDPLTSNEVNVTGTLNILNAAREARIKRLVYASSSSIYGDLETLPKTEDMLPKPLSPYAVSKMAGEKYCMVFHTLYGLETVALRYFNVFGPHQDPTSQYSAVIPKFVSAMLQGKAPLIYGDGQQSRDFTFVANVVRANLLACEHGLEDVSGQVFNIATGRRITLNKLVETLNEILGTEIQPQYADARPGDVKHSLANIGKAQQFLGYQPQADLRTGLQAVVDWMKENTEKGKR
ncbi:MAG TPA: SDR family oxidoreductase [bacterium]|nr:SDR family oxidoreductase [bacterium]HPG44803.1 SDR family oxidoreductase [bacterium]HPM99688.1 SDR family oxidoreductase [bacterium]